MHVHFYLFTVPSPVVEVASIYTVEFGETTTLECNVTAVRGITSRVDIIWITGYNHTIVRRIEDVEPYILGNSAVYIDTLVTSPLNINDNGRFYNCAVTINSTFGVSSYAIIVLHLTG